MSYIARIYRAYKAGFEGFVSYYIAKEKHDVACLLLYYSCYKGSDIYAKYDYINEQFCRIMGIILQYSLYKEIAYIIMRKTVIR